jgi:hypothetical protein
MIYMSDEEEEGEEEEECPICTDPLHEDIHRWAWQEVKVTKIIVTKIHRWAWQEVEVAQIKIILNLQVGMARGRSHKDHLDENSQVGIAR